ncbi:MAG TPA: xanthine dehydrogenase accessory protein XdhC [Lacipirellulaceae bacterium]|nr:xanthine dehydrogenase accessory protein XdhC [Lacipirellulaceae bacterium]
MPQHGFIERLAELSASGQPFACVTLVDAVGSTPQDAGSKLLVTAQGLDMGTVGGGRVEAKAIAHAQAMLAGSAATAEGPAVAPPQVQFVEWNLQRDVGMTCGGAVKLYFETFNHGQWHIVIFGAGHVAGALVHCLAPLECTVRVIDPREEWLARLPSSPRLVRVCSDDPPADVASLPAGAFVLCMTMGHRTDRPILAEIFRQDRRFPYVGAIGSQAKRKVLERELALDGVAAAQLATLRCPLGLELGSNHPGEIAISVAAELIQRRDAWRRSPAAPRT